MKDEDLKGRKIASKGSKFSRRFKGSRSKKFAPEKATAEAMPGNDFGYWNKYPDYMKSVTNYPWMHVAGTPITTHGYTTTNLNVGNVVVVNYAPSIGVCWEATDAFNLMWRDVYLAMHRKYRGLGAYQQSDLGIAILCNASIFAQIAECERLYGIIHGYPVKNRVNPRGLLRAMGYTNTFIDLLEANPASFRSNLNRIIIKAKRLCLPKGLTALYNWIGLNSFVYRDSKDNPDRAGIIVFQPNGYFHYDATRASGVGTHQAGGCAVYAQQDKSGIASPAAMLATLDGYVDLLLADDDITRICSDVISCFGDNGLEAMNEVPEDFKVEPVYEESILIKLHNAECVGDSSHPYITTIEDANISFTPNPAPNENIVYQLDNIIRNAPIVTSPSGSRVLVGAGGGSHFYGEASSTVLTRNTQDKTLIDTWEAEPSDATRCEATLWKEVTDYVIGGATIGASTHHAVSIQSCSTEIIINISVNAVTNNAVQQSYVMGTFYNESMISGSQFVLLSQIDWAPYLYFGYDDATGIFPHRVMGDIDNFAAIQYSLLGPIHDAALLSGFNIQVPGAASKE